MATTQATFGELISASFNSFRVAFAVLRPRLVPALIVTVAPPIISALVLFLTIGSATLTGAGILAAFQGGDQTAQIAEGAALATITFGAILAILLLAPLGAFFAFCCTRFVVRANQDHTRTFTVGELFAPDASFFSFLGLQFLVALAGTAFLVVGIIVALVTFFLLGLPAYFVYFFFVAFWTCSAFAFFESSSSGVTSSLSRGFTLIRKDWKRWFTMSLVMIGVALILGVLGAVFGATLNKIPVVGPITGKILSSLVCLYLAFVMNQCYRESSAAIPN